MSNMHVGPHFKVQLLCFTLVCNYRVEMILQVLGAPVAAKCNENQGKSSTVPRECSQVQRRSIGL